MKLRYIFLAAIVTALSWHAEAQAPHPCGTVVTQAQLNYLNQTLAQRQSFDFKAQRAVVTSFPVQNHVVRQSNGSGGLSASQLASVMADLNAYYINANIQFFECAPVNYIDNSTYYDFNESQENAITNSYEVDDVINIYYFNSISSGSSSLCGYAYFPPGPDRVMMDNSCALNGTTIVHELGHYFSLYHTHGTSNCGTTDELVNGSNCTTAGDDVCDTPADPNLLQGCSTYVVNSSCIYTGALTDANGDPYNPQTSNIMSYSRSQCRMDLTQGQYNRIAYSAAYDRSYLTCSSCPDPTNAQAGNIGIYEAEIQWTSSNPGADYSIEWGTSGFLPGGAGSVDSISGTSASGTNTANITGLTPGTDYDFYIWEDCPSSGQGQEGPYSFTTIALVNSFPSCEDFESFSLCNTSCGNSCILSGGWANLSTDDIDWTIDENGTPSNNTGPTSDHTNGNSSGNYLYTEATGSCSSKTAIMATPVYDFSSVANPSIEFWYHMLGSNMGTLQLEIESPYESNNWVNIFSRSGAQGSSWNLASINLSAYAGNHVRFQFTGATGAGFASDMAIDDVCVDGQPALTISGIIHTTQNIPITGVTVELSGSDSQSVLTGADGTYSFDVAPGGDYVVAPSKSNDSIPNDGVTTFDITLARRHILIVDTLDSPYKIIAGDINEELGMSTGDILQIRSLILGNTLIYPSGKLWQFIKSDYAFSDPLHPFTFDKTRTYDNLTTNQANQNFIGVKLGDVNESWSPGQ